MPINQKPPTPPHPQPLLLVGPKHNMTPPSSNTKSPSSSSSSPSSSSSSFTTKCKSSKQSNDPTNQACAVCKYQRRRCNPDCALAPYFPADNQPQFLNAHRLFGVRNILRILKNLDPGSRHEAMRSIIFQSNARAFDPVGGCYRIILNLQQQIERESAELSCVLQQLAVLRGDREREQEQEQEQQQQQQQQQNYGYLCYDGNALEMKMLSLQQREKEEEEEVVDGVVNGVEAPDFVDAFTFSAKSLELKEELNSIEPVQEHDLKEAASLFTLTNCNTSPV